MGRKGATLLEVLLATSMLVVVLVTVSLIFPRASKVVTANRQHLLASNFAATRLEDLKSQPYSMIPVNRQTDFAGTPGFAACDCSVVDMSQMPIDLVGEVPQLWVDAGITYTRRRCINLVDRSPVTGLWTSNCPDDTNATDKGFKNIRVRVEWSSGGLPYMTDTETLAARHE